MDAIECIKTRMSIRKFRPETVPEKTLLEVLEAARWSPSYKNTQPWNAVVVSGAEKEKLSALLTGLLEKGAEPTPDLPEPPAWPEAEAARIAFLLERRSRTFGVDMNSPEVRRKSKIANFNFYGAPHAVFLHQSASLVEWSVLDIGMFCQTLMLAARALGLGTVPQAFLTDYASETKKFLGIDPSHRLVLGISIGYPDMDAPVNSLRTTRAEPSEFARFL